jgi:serine beta-lactamase-like protein LACTB
MTKQIKALSLLVVLATAFISPAPESAESVPNSTMERIDLLLEEIHYKEGYPGVSAAIYVGGDRYYTAQSGFSDVASSIAPDENTIFRVYSLTKGITQILAATLVDDGLLDLEEPIATYIPDLPAHLRTVTPRQLLAHRSGIRHYRDDQEWIQLSQEQCRSTEQAFQQFVRDPLLFEPGTDTHYTSFGYVLLSRVLEASGGAPFHKLMEQRVWFANPAGRIAFDAMDSAGKET